MRIVLPASLESGLTEAEARLGLALGLYVCGRIGFGRAADMAGLSRPAFQRVIARQRVPADYSLEDLREDAEAIQQRAK